MIVKCFKSIVVVLFVYLALPNLLFAQQTLKIETQPLVLEQISVIDVEKGRIMPNFSVVITGERISALGKTGEVRIPKNARIIDAGGKFLIPGLWDMHVHLSLYADTKQPPLTAFPALIANGVTGVRDLGGDLEQIDRWRKEITDGTLAGPRIFGAGPFVDGPKKMGELRTAQTIVVKNTEEARAAVRNLKQRGVDFVKVHNGIPRDAYRALVDECRRQKILLATHLPTSVRITEASDAGTHSIEHIEMLTESIAYDVAPGEKPKGALAALEELTDEKANALFARFARNKMWYTPTLVAYYTFLQEAEENFAKDPTRWKNAMEGRGKMFARFKQYVGMMRRAGVGILAATDFSSKSGVSPYPVPQPGTDLHKELAYFVESGMTPLEALQTATLNPAKSLNIQKNYGTVAKGKMADLILLDSNPLADIKNTRSIFAVVLGGKLISNSELQAMNNK